jgi:hypothetical protein
MMTYSSCTRPAAVFAEKASRVLDLYANMWEGIALGPDEFVTSADEKPSLQA